MARPVPFIRTIAGIHTRLAQASSSTARQSLTGFNAPYLPRNGSSSTQPHAHPHNVLNLDFDLPSPPQRSTSTAHLKENEYASTYQVSEEDLPPEERQYKRIPMERSRLVFVPDGVLLYRGEQSDAISHQRLRDNCRCPRCIDPSTRQKLRSSGSAASIKLSKAFEGYDAAGQKGVHFVWSDGHSSFYGEEHLRDMVAFSEGKTNVNHHFKRRFWDQEILLQSPNLRMTYDQVQSKEGLLAMLRQAQVYGLVVVSEVPAERTSDKDCELRAFMTRIGEIRNTFYGETWDVKSMVNSKNVAYTSQDLGFHMDLLYFSSPPRWQALHCLRNRVEGGSSYFTDAFFAGRHIQHTDPATTAVLARYPLDFEYDNDGHYLRCRHFVMNQLDSLRAHINWSPPFQAPVRRIAGKGQPARQSLKIEKDFYDALAKFEASLHRPGVQYEFRMEEGDLVFFDNRRVLHARREFGPGERWLKGCYLDGEVVWDKLVTMQP